MKRRMAGLICAVALLALPAASLGGNGDSDGPIHARKAKGHIVARDSAKRRPATAVARVTLRKFRGVFYEIRSTPGHLPLDWGITARCVRGPVIDYFPDPGQFTTKSKNSVIAGKFPVPLKNPDFCTFAVAGTLHSLKQGKGVKVSIAKRG